MFNFGDISGWIVPTAAILGWALISLYRLYLVGRTREQAHRERMAMIERGVQPPPPESAALPLDWRGSTDPAARNRRTGIILIGVGVGLSAMLLTIGTGGRSMGASVFLVILGLAFLLIAMLEQRSSRKNRSVQPPSA
jgi:Domain of unknown function (DUF6249)